MKEIPLAYVRANQWGIAIFVALALAFQEPYIILALWVVQVLGWLNGMKGNLFIQLSKPYLEKHIAGGKTEAAELQKFNNTLAVILLSVSVVLLMSPSWVTAGYIVAIMVGLAALAAILGYCIGCTIYFQYKQWKSRQNSKSH